MAKNKVALFLCAIYNYASSSSTMVKFSVTTGVVSLDQFFIKVFLLISKATVYPTYKVTLIRFSIVAMDVEDVERSGKFTIVFFYQDFAANVNQYIALPN